MYLKVEANLRSSTAPGSHHLRGSPTVMVLSAMRVSSAVRGKCESSFINGGEAKRRCDLSFCNGLNCVPQIVVEVLDKNVAVCGDRHL